MWFPEFAEHTATERIFGSIKVQLFKLFLLVTQLPSHKPNVFQIKRKIEESYVLK
jgi:hypothetical protein